MSRTEFSHCTKSVFRSITILNDCFICAVQPHQASAKPHLPAELPRTLKGSLPSTLLCFAVRLFTKATDTKTHEHTHTHKHTHKHLPLLLPASGAVNRPLCKWRVSWSSVISCPLLDHPTRTRHTFSVIDFTRTWSLSRFQIVLLAEHKEQQSFCINGRISLRFPSLKHHLTGNGCDTRQRTVQLYPPLVMLRPFQLILGIFLVIALVYELALYGTSAGS